nr:MAG TPA: hypothetical protein [Crassvirales sp.]
MITGPQFYDKKNKKSTNSGDFVEFFSKSFDRSEGKTYEFLLNFIYNISLNFCITYNEQENMFSAIVLDKNREEFITFKFHKKNNDIVIALSTGRNVSIKTVSFMINKLKEMLEILNK